MSTLLSEDNKEDTIEQFKDWYLSSEEVDEFITIGAQEFIHNVELRPKPSVGRKRRREAEALGAKKRPKPAQKPIQQPYKIIPPVVPKPADPSPPKKLSKKEQKKKQRVIFFLKIYLCNPYKDV